MTEPSARSSLSLGLVLTVRLGGSLHAIPIWAVEEVLPALPIEWLPNCLAFVRGVVFVRGHLIPVIDAAERFGMKRDSRPYERHLVCLRVDGRLIALEFDEALDLVDLGDAELLTLDVAGIRSSFFAGVVQRDSVVIRILDPAKLLASAESGELERVPQSPAPGP